MFKRDDILECCGLGKASPGFTITRIHCISSSSATLQKLVNLKSKNLSDQSGDCWNWKALVLVTRGRLLVLVDRGG